MTIRIAATGAQIFGDFEVSGMKGLTDVSLVG